MLAQRGQGGLPPQAMMLLTFLAGMGADKFGKFLQTMRGGGAPSHKATGMQGDAARNPGQAIPQQLAALLAARGGPQAGGMPAMPMMPPGMAR